MTSLHYHYVCRYYGDNRFADPTPEIFHDIDEARDYLRREAREWREDEHEVRGDAEYGYFEISMLGSDRVLALSLAEFECWCPPDER